MFNRDQRGQSVILIAVSIVLVLVVAFAAYNVQMFLVFKQKIRQLADSTALAGGLSRKVGFEGYQMLANLDLMLVVSWEMGAAYENILDGANYVHNTVPGYDATADLLATSNEIKNIVPVKNHIAHVHEQGIVKPETYNKAQQFLILESLIYAREVQTRNLSIATMPKSNHLSMLIPSEMFVNQGPVLPFSDANYKPFNWIIGMKHGRMIFLVEQPNGTNVPFETSVGLSCFEVVDSPNPLIQNLLSTVFTTTRSKLVSYAYAYPYNLEDEEGYPFEPINVFLEEFETINTTNLNRVKTLKQLANKPSPTTTDIQNLKATWSALVADYNYFFDIAEDSGLLNVMNIAIEGNQLNPVLGSIHKLNLTEFPGYEAIATSKGIDISTPEGEATFYKSVTLQDIFGSVDDFWQDLYTTYQSLIANNTAITTDLSDILNTCKFYDLGSSAGNNIPYYFQDLPNKIHNGVGNSSLDPFLSLSSVVSQSIVSCYNHLLNLTTITSSITSVTPESLMPDSAMKELLPQLFTVPLVRWEGS